MRCNIYHAYSYKVVVAKRTCQRNHHCHKCNSLLTHAEHGSEKSEEQHYQSDHDVAHSELAHQRMTLQILHLGDELHDALVDSLCAVDNPERTSDYEHECYDAGLLAEAFIQGRKNLPGLRLASWHKPGGDSADQ